MMEVIEKDLLVVVNDFFRGNKQPLLGKVKELRAIKNSIANNFSLFERILENSRLQSYIGFSNNLSY